MNDWKKYFSGDNFDLFDNMPEKVLIVHRKTKQKHKNKG